MQTTWLREHCQYLWLLVAAVLLALTWDPRLGLAGDNAEYILLARSLLAGDGLSIAGIEHAKYPIGYPAVLAAIGWVIAGWSWMKLPAGVALLALVLAVLRTTNWKPDTWWWMALLVTCPLLLDFSHQVMPEVLFALMVYLGLVGVVGRKRTVTLGYALLVGACLIKTVAVVFVVAAVVWEVRIGRTNRWGLLLPGGLVLMGLVKFVSGWAPVDTFYLDQAFLLNPYYPEYGQIGFYPFIARVLGNLAWYVGEFWVYGLCAAIVTYHTWEQEKKVDAGPDLFNWAMLAYLPIILVWPWPAHRLLVPILPLLLVQTGMSLSSSMPNRWGYSRRSIQVFGGTLLALGLLVGYQGFQLYTMATEPKVLPPRWQKYAEVAEYLGEHTPPETVICARKPYWLGVISGRSQVIPYPLGDIQTVHQWWDERQVDCVVYEELGFRSTQQHLVPAIAAGVDAGLWEFWWGVNEKDAEGNPAGPRAAIFVRTPP